MPQNPHLRDYIPSLARVSSTSICSLLSRREYSLATTNVQRTLRAGDSGVPATFCFGVTVGPAHVVGGNA